MNIFFLFAQVIFMCEGFHAYITCMKSSINIMRLAISRENGIARERFL